MSRKKPQIDAVRWEERGGTYYYIYFPGSGQHVSVLARGLKHYEVKTLFYVLAKVAPTLLGLNGAKVQALGKTWKFTAGQYVPIEGECGPEECPRFYVHGYTSPYEPGEVWIYFQRHQTGTKAVSLAVALSRKQSRNIAGVKI